MPVSQMSKTHQTPDYATLLSFWITAIVRDEKAVHVITSPVLSPGMDHQPQLLASLVTLSPRNVQRHYVTKKGLLINAK